MTFDLNDLESLALCAWKEARSDGVDAMRAVAHVIVNRARRWYAATSEAIHTAVYAKNQFSSMSIPSDPQYRIMPAPVDPRWQQIQVLVKEIADGTDADLTNGALYYANLATMADQSGWFKRNIVEQPALHPERAKIGSQTFYA